VTPRTDSFPIPLKSMGRFEFVQNSISVRLPPRRNLTLTPIAAPPEMAA